MGNEVVVVVVVVVVMVVGKEEGREGERWGSGHARESEGRSSYMGGALRRGSAADGVSLCCYGGCVDPTHPLHTLGQVYLYLSTETGGTKLATK